MTYATSAYGFYLEPNNFQDIDAFKAVYPDVELEVILCHPDLETFKRNARKRHGVSLHDKILENLY